MGSAEVIRSISEQGALFWIGVGKGIITSYLVFEIDGGKRIYQHLSHGRQQPEDSASRQRERNFRKTVMKAATPATDAAGRPKASGIP